MSKFRTIEYDSSKNLKNCILLELNEQGFVLIRNFPITTSVEKDFLEFNEKIGTPVSHDLNDNYVWHIKQNIQSNSEIMTFSEHNHEASLHTDSQYSINPEDFFSLLCLKKANCGGGQSNLLKLTDLVNELKLTDEGNKCLTILNKYKFPFITPSAFNSNHQVNFGYILKNNEIRYRIDVIEKAFEKLPQSKTKEKLFALNYLKHTIQNSPNIISFHLNEGDIVFINNKTVLHGRESFEDPLRHLIRVRLNKRI
jgi:alpha-ketoglutarate-dependent taurine dioxygenase